MEEQKKRTDDARAAKKAIRAEVKQRKGRLTAQEKAQQAVATFRNLSQLEAFRDAKTVMLYCALPDELDTYLFMGEIHGGKRVALPVVNGEDLLIREYAGQACLQAVPPFGVLEPQETAIIAPLEVDIAVIPGIAFDSEGWRVGRGKGYYDRLLARMPDVCRVGVGFSCQGYEHVPHEAHDMRMDYVITGTTVQRTCTQEA